MQCVKIVCLSLVLLFANISNCRTQLWAVSFLASPPLFHHMQTSAAGIVEWPLHRLGIGCKPKDVRHLYTSMGLVDSELLAAAGWYDAGHWSGVLLGIADLGLLSHIDNIEAGHHQFPPCVVTLLSARMHYNACCTEFAGDMRYDLSRMAFQTYQSLVNGMFPCKCRPLRALSASTAGKLAFVSDIAVFSRSHHAAINNGARATLATGSSSSGCRSVPCGFLRSLCRRRRRRAAVAALNRFGRHNHIHVSERQSTVFLNTLIKRMLYPQYVPPRPPGVTSSLI
jgi:hypothetical protein